MLQAGLYGRAIQRADKRDRLRQPTGVVRLIIKIHHHIFKTPKHFKSFYEVEMAGQNNVPVGCIFDLLINSLCTYLKRVCRLLDPKAVDVVKLLLVHPRVQVDIHPDLAEP